MEDETVVLAEGTAPDPTPEQTADEEPSSPEGTPSGQTLTAEETSPKGGKAQERITDLVRERNELRRQLEARSQYEPPAAPKTYAGVTEDGIDPVTYGESLMKEARTEAQKAVAFEVQKMEVMKDPLMKGEYAQLQVSSLIDRGYGPLEALDAFKEQWSEIEKEASRKAKARDEAGKFTRDSTGIAPAGKTAQASGSFTNAQIDAMSLDEYAKNETEIKRQMRAGLIK